MNELSSIVNVLSDKIINIAVCFVVTLEEFDNAGDNHARP